jgi:hypothetical protein
MQQRRIVGNYPTLSGHLRVPSGSPAGNTLARSSTPPAPEHDSADEGFICDDEEHVTLRHELSALRFELEQQDANHCDLQALEAAIAKRERQLEQRAREAASRRDKRKMDEQRAAEERALAAEVRALRLATAEAMVQQRAAELEALEARVASFKEAGFGDKVQAARDHAALAKAREELAKAKLKALQLK